MKNFLKFAGALFVVTVSLGFANAQDGEQLIKESINKIKDVNFLARPTITRFQIGHGEVLVKEEYSFDYRRKMDNGSYSAKVILPDYKLLFITNDSGNYAVYNNKYAAQVLALPIRNLPNDLVKNIPDREFETAKYTVRETTYDSEPYYEVVMETTTDPKILREISGNPEQYWEKYGEQLLANKTMKRIFIIGKDDHMLRGITLFDPRGEKKVELDLGKVTIQDDMSDELFRTPRKLVGKMLTPYDLVKKYQVKEKPEEEAFSFQTVKSIMLVVIVVFAVLLTVSIIVKKLRKA